MPLSFMRHDINLIWQARQGSNVSVEAADEAERSEAVIPRSPKGAVGTTRS